jgi:DNA (cytosine-5)-methyltransferase 1
MDYSTNSRAELINFCKQRGISGYGGGKSKSKLIKLLNRPYRVLSLFSGMGGMDVGFAEQVVVHKNSVVEEFIHTPSTTPDFVNLKRLPFEVVFQNDILPAAKTIAELNGWAHNYHLMDIRDMLKENFSFPAADVVTGGFPCQDFSHAGKRAGFDSSRGTLYQSFVDVVKRVMPIVFVAENVHGLLTMPEDPIQQIIGDFSDAGYDVKYQLIKCEEYGIPQTRWRVIIMGVRIDKLDKLDDEDWNRIDENQRSCYVRSYLQHLQEPVISDDPAQTVYSKAARLEKGQGQKEVGLDEYGPTMRAEHHGNIEFRRVDGGNNNEPGLGERRLTVREAALIQTFPPSCILTQPTRVSSMAYKPIGNAVPPLLGYIIARKVHQILEAVKD